jgi:hypothetical protein
VCGFDDLVAGRIAAVIVIEIISPDSAIIALAKEHGLPAIQPGIDAGL